MKLNINNQGLLFKSNKQIDEYMIKCLDELKNHSTQELRASQQDIYNAFIKAKTGADIGLTASRDPFIDVTGFPLKVFTLDRFKKYPLSPIVMSATTDFAPIRYVRTARPMTSTHGSSYERYSKEFKLKGNRIVQSTFRFPGGPLTLKNSPWKSYYAANDHTITKKGETFLYFIYGLIFLDDEPVRHLMNTPQFENLYKLMTTVANEFSHDFTGHGSIDFVINYTPEASVYGKNENKDSDECTKVLSEIRKQYLSGSRVATIFDELRQLNLHMHLIEACIKRNEKYMLEIVENANTFFDLLKTATGNMVGNHSEQVYKYFGQLYIFCLARMLPAHYMPAVIRPSELEMFTDFLEQNGKEGHLNVFSSIGYGLPVLKQGFGREVDSFGIGDIAYYLDHRTIFANTYNALMK